MEKHIKHAYLAGILDGEGSIGYSHKDPEHPKRRFQMLVEMTDERVPKMFKEEFGGTYFTRDRSAQPGRKNEKPTFVWAVTSKKARDAYRTLEPYMVLKKNKL